MVSFSIHNQSLNFFDSLFLDIYSSKLAKSNIHKEFWRLMSWKIDLFFLQRCQKFHKFCMNCITLIKNAEWLLGWLRSFVWLPRENQIEHRENNMTSKYITTRKTTKNRPRISTWNFFEYSNILWSLMMLSHFA